MKNQTLKFNLKHILTQKDSISLTKGEISGASIEITNTKTGDDLGSFTYYGNEANRDSDYNTLMNLLK